MRPFDPRLIRRARSARRFLVGSTLVGTASAVLVVAFAYLIARIITRVFQGGMTVGEISPLLGWLAVVVVLRAGTSYLMEVLATRGSAGVKRELREQLLAQVSALGPVWLSGQRRSDLVLLMGRGLDGLDNYFARFLPQLILSFVVPVVVIGVIFTQDWLSALIVIVTLPLIPVFMVLIGKRTEHAQRRQWQNLIRLGGHFLDVVRGLPTLKIFGRSQAQVSRVQEIGENYRKTTMKVLRISFLSSLALELLATLSVAIIAVEIGVRLVDGTLMLFVGLFVLLLAPEAYLPLRLVGQHFHASQEGVTAVEAAFRVLDEPIGMSSGDHCVAVCDATINLHNVEVTYPTVEEPALRTTLQVQPGEIVGLVGPSGCGKTTLLLVLARLTRPTGGDITVTETNGVAVNWDTIDTADWRSQVAYLPQHPVFVVGSVADNVRLVAPAATDAEIVHALRACGASFVLEHPDGIEWALGENGVGMSVGQRQRVALARILIRDPALVLLDEPTAALDGPSEREVVEAIRGVAVGRTVVVVAHRQPLIDMADRVITMSAPRLSATEALT